MKDDRKKLKRGKLVEDYVVPILMVGVLAAITYAASRGYTYEVTHGSHEGHTVTAREFSTYKTLHIDGKAGGRLRAEDNEPLGNWDGSEDRMNFTGVSEADSLYRFTYPEELETIYSKVMGGEGDK